MTQYVGIFNWPEKPVVLASAPVGRRSIETASIVFDCERHIDFLRGLVEALHEPGEVFHPETTLYYSFYARLKGEAAARERAERFADLFRRVRDGGADLSDAVKVTEDGARLDGSHRAAIAYVLGVGELPADVYRWESALPAWRVRHIREEVSTKQMRHFERRDREAYWVKDGSRAGRVLFSDFLGDETQGWVERLLGPMTIPGLGRRFKFETIVALAGPAGRFYAPESELEYR